jgi:phosphatidylserine/phosphatidylglycerophosphate/cardiolipin synthase-like enzyme
MRRRFGHESFFSSFRPVSHRERRNADLFLTELMAGGRIRSSASMLRPPSESTLEDVGPSTRRDDTGYWFVDMKGFLGGAFAPTHPLWMPDPRPGNDVKILLNGQETYREMINALDPYPKKWGPDSFIYLSNWIVYDDFNLDRDPQFRLVSTPRTTLRDCLRRASDHNVLIRALFWDRVIKSGSTHQNDGPRDFINSLRTGHAILDGRVINSVIGDTYDKGSHHQKLLLVNGPEGLLAFAGGVDFHPNRVFQHGDPLDAPPGTGSPVKRLDDKSAPLLDVHVRIRGPAAYDLLDVFLRRYADHPTAANHEIYAPYRDYKPLPSGRVTVRVCTTFGDKPIRDDTNVSPTQKTLQLLEGPQTERPYRQTNVVTIKQDGGGRLRGIQPYSFAPRGRQSGRAQLLFAISSARKFIYFEDQYMVGQEIAEAIRDVVNAHGVKVIGVIPHQSISNDFDQETLGYFRGDGGRDVLAHARLSRVIRVIYGTSADPKDRRFLFSPLQLKPDPKGSIYQYVHSKVFIMDDAFCTIGSMNFNQRSTTHDSELSLGFYEPNPTGDGFAKRLRLRLWQQHLRLPASEQRLIDDPLECIAKVWSRVEPSPVEIKSPGGARWKPGVVRYDWSRDKPLGTREFPFIDPLGAGFTDETRWVDKIPDPLVTSAETKRVPKRLLGP